ncbi:MAG: transcription-repair coupling factor, partial [Bacteroidales bacterium]|nr:transcription-repair coupling factor [Bacteroidales bacterium]
DQIQRQEDLIQFETGLTDRFGPLPGPSLELLQVVRLRWLANRLGFEKIVLKNGKLIGYFIADPDSAFYKSETFSHILSLVQKQPRPFRMKEHNNRLTLTCDPLISVSEANELLMFLSAGENQLS